MVYRGVRESPIAQLDWPARRGASPSQLSRLVEISVPRGCHRGPVSERGVLLTPRGARGMTERARAPPTIAEQPQACWDPAGYSAAKARCRGLRWGVSPRFVPRRWARLPEDRARYASRLAAASVSLPGMRWPYRSNVNETFAWPM